jgi:hypothetical protein
MPEMLLVAKIVVYGFPAALEFSGYRYAEVVQYSGHGGNQPYMRISIEHRRSG